MKPASNLKKSVNHIKVIHNNIEESKQEKQNLGNNVLVLKKYIRMSANSAHQLKWSNGKMVNKINLEIEKSHRLAPLLNQCLENKDTVEKEIPVIDQKCQQLFKKKRELLERI